MGNLWSSSKIRPVHGTYLEDRPRRRRALKQRVPVERAPTFIPFPEPQAPSPALRVVRHPVPYKEKALRIFHELYVKQYPNRDMSLQKQE